MNDRRKIIELTGCDPDEATAIEMAAYLLNKQEELRTVQDLRPDEFAALVERAKAIHVELRARIHNLLTWKENTRS